MEIVLMVLEVLEVGMEVLMEIRVHHSQVVVVCLNQILHQLFWQFLPTTDVLGLAKIPYHAPTWNLIDNYLSPTKWTALGSS